MYGSILCDTPTVEQLACQEMKAADFSGVTEGRAERLGIFC
jgi:hypothetical protein